jgi:predicted homoserine dehydrogenase-like protein
MKTLIPRRGFLKAGVSALGLAPLFIRAAGPSSPNSQITIGIIGYGAMGKVNTTNFLNIPDARVVAVSDVDAHEASAAKAAVDGHYKNSDCKTYAHSRVSGCN